MTAQLLLCRVVALASLAQAGARFRPSTVGLPLRPDRGIGHRTAASAMDCQSCSREQTETLVPIPTESTEQKTDIMKSHFELLMEIQAEVVNFKDSDRSTRSIVQEHAETLRVL